MAPIWWLSLVTITGALIGPALCKRKYIEMTHEIQERIVTYPGLPKYNFTILERGDKRGFWLEYNKFQLSEHAGTHMDAPIHFNRHGSYVHEVSLEKLIGPGVIIDISDRAERDRRAQVGIDDIKRWEETNGRIPKGAFVIMKSGWFRKYPDTTQIFGVDIDEFPPTDFRFPGISPTAAQWLIDNRDIHGVGGDTPSPDRGGNTGFPTHRIVLGANKIILENVANLDKVPPSGATIYALPINLRRGSGGPIRIFATLNDGEDNDYNSARRPMPFTAVFVLCVLLLRI